MSHLVALFEEMGFAEVKTFIASGNDFLPPRQ